MRSRAFTLAEAMVSLGLLTLLGASAFLTIQFVLRSSAKRTQQSQSMQQLESLLQLLRSDLQSATAASLSLTGTANTTLSVQPVTGVAANNATVTYSTETLLLYRLGSDAVLRRHQWNSNAPVALVSPPLRLTSAQLDNFTGGFVRVWPAVEQFTVTSEVTPPLMGALVELRLKLRRWGDEILDVRRTVLLRNPP